MAWEFIGHQRSTEVTSGNITVDLAFTARTGTTYTDFSPGDLLIGGVSYRSNAAFTLPSGWTLVATQQSSGNTTVDTTGSIASAVMAYIIRGAAAPDLVWVRTGGDVANCTIFGYRGCAASPYDTGSANTLAVAAITATTTTITTAENGELLVCLLSGARGGASSTGNTFDAATGATTDSSTVTDVATEVTSNTWFRRRGLATTVGADSYHGFADALMTTAGATGTVQANTGTSARAAMIVGAFKARKLGTGRLDSFRLERMSPL